ncbi:MAG: cobalamin B12-binding domain-containing protein, partial [Elusimicrobiota bacterium]
MKIVICTTPIRPTPTDYPPFGSMAIIQSLRKDGWDPTFYDIDGLRPSPEDVERFFAESQPDIVGISAVVSTAYAYTKKLVLMIQRVAPGARIIVGGNLAASAEILHRLVGIDYCVIGEGDVVVRNLMNYFKPPPGRTKAEAPLLSIPGNTYLDASGEMVFTGHEAPIAADELFEPDYLILEKHSLIGNFVNDPMTRPDFAADPRSQQAHRKGKKMATLITTKGCVARCTFCHRFTK